MAGRVSLWLVPEEAARSRLDAVIVELASRLRTPAFRAHVTLLGSVRQEEAQALEAAQKAARQTPPMRLTLARVVHDPEYYRCVVLEAEATPELLGAHQRARRALGGGPDRFRPHLSMVYGRFDEATRRELAVQVERTLEPPLVVEATRIEVHETRGAPSSWRLCGSFPLEG